MQPSLSPHIADEYSPLDELARRAFRRYGEMNPSSISGEAAALMLDLSQQVVDDFNEHPLRPSARLPYYVHETDRRPIPDAVVQAGLLAYYAVQQDSGKATGYLKLYFHTLNRTLYGLTNPDNQRPELRAYDREGGR